MLTKKEEQCEQKSRATQHRSHYLLHFRLGIVGVMNDKSGNGQEGQKSQKGRSVVFKCALRAFDQVETQHLPETAWREAG